MVHQNTKHRIFCIFGVFFDVVLFCQWGCFLFSRSPLPSHEISAKITPWEISFVIVEGFCALEIFWKRDFFNELCASFVIFAAIKHLFQDRFSLSHNNVSEGKLYLVKPIWIAICVWSASHVVIMRPLHGFLKLTSAQWNGWPSPSGVDQEVAMSPSGETLLIRCLQFHHQRGTTPLRGSERELASLRVLCLGAQEVWQWNSMAMSVAKFGWTFWPFLPRNPTFSCVLPSHCFELFVRMFAWTFAIPNLFWSLICRFF